jgi:tetratricopeptide (TPR) repeat protein
MEVVAIRENQPAPAEPAEIEAGGSQPCYATAEKVQEIQYYLSQEMWEAAKKAILDLTEIAPDAAEITEFIAAVSAGQSRAAAAAAAAAAPPPVVPKPSTSSPLIAAPKKPPVAPPAPAVEAAEDFVTEVESEPAPAHQPAPKFPLEKIAAPPTKAAPSLATPPATPSPVHHPAAPHAAEEAPLEDILVVPAQLTAPLALEDVLEVARARPPQPAPPIQRAAARERSTEDILTDFVQDMEKSDLADFVPRAKPEPVPPAKAHAAQAATTSPAAPVAAPRREAPVNGDMRDAESASVLSDILSELQEETDGAAEAEEDPETHYNLGIAFKEMGLLDEAIGELQKVCHAMDGGSSFSQPIQAYTWLAQCLVDKGAPEAAVRWYRRALQLPRLDDGSRCAIYYDLALAYEASGDNKSALANFMEVYGSNIDFRDVSSRIKALKS